jgi:hypothetical protein
MQPNLELTAYRTTRINKLKKQFDIDKQKLDANANSAVQYILRSNDRASFKLTQVNKIMSENSKQVASLQKKLQDAINKINEIQPKIVEIKNKKNALLIGCKYLDTNYELIGCINDTKNLKELVEKNNFNNVKILTDDTIIKPTKQNILNEITAILANAKSGDSVFISYSGHGSNILDRNNDETDGRDEVIISLDLKSITDDELRRLINENLKEDVTLFALFDSCSSGTVLDLPYQYLDSMNYDKFTENPKVSDTKGNVIMISGCTDNQYSTDAFIDGNGQGAMTWSFLKSIKNNPKITYRELIRNMRDLLKTNNYGQLPQLSTGQLFNIDTPILL